MHEFRYWYQCKSAVSGKFCYLGDMLSVDKHADAAVETRIQIGWNELVSLLTNKDISLVVKGRLYSSVCTLVCCMEVRPGP